MKATSIADKAIDYIENNLEEDLYLDNIAEYLNYSKFYISRMFAEKVGCTIHKYIQMRRLTEAARKLVETEKPVVEIALEANYNSQQAFILAFKQEYLYTPQAYRKRGIFISKKPRFTVNSNLSFSDVSCMAGGGMAA